jgi:3-hydroxyisobutyrate dehydrogenase
LRPAFAAMGRKTVWLGEAGQGSKLKLAVNAYMSTPIKGAVRRRRLGQLPREERRRRILSCG